MRRTFDGVYYTIRQITRSANYHRTINNDRPTIIVVIRAGDIRGAPFNKWVIFFYGVCFSCLCHNDDDYVPGDHRSALRLSMRRVALGAAIMDVIRVVAQHNRGFLDTNRTGQGTEMHPVCSNRVPKIQKRFWNCPSCVANFLLIFYWN